MTSNHAILFPGQGAQRADMGAPIFDIYTKLVAEAEEIAEFSIRDFFGIVLRIGLATPFMFSQLYIQLMLCIIVDILMSLGRYHYF